MITLDATQQAIVAAESKTFIWLFDITESGSGSVDYRYSTKTYTYDSQNYTAAIDPESFDGIHLTMGSSELGIQAPDDLSFAIVNKNNTITASDLIGAEVLVRLVMDDGTDEEVIRQFKMRIQRSDAIHQKINVECVDFLQEYLKGYFPNTPFVKTIFPDDNIDSGLDDALCIPHLYGTAYLPIRSAYITDARYYVLGLAAYSYTISEVHTPRNWPIINTWGSGSYTFTQSSKTDGDSTDWRVFQPIIADSDSDGTPDACGLWYQGGQFLNPLVKLTRSDTVSMTGPEDVIENFLETIGVASGDIDTGVGSTFESMGTTYTSWGLSFNGGFFYKRPTESILALLLTQGNALLSIEDKIRIRERTTTSRATLDTGDIVKDSFQYDPIEPNGSDSAYIAMAPSGEPQDVLLKYRVSATGTYDTPAEDVLEVNLVQDTQDVQRIGIIHFQYKFLPNGRARFNVHESHLGLEPGDFITLNDAAYGGTIKVMVQEMHITADLDVWLEVVYFSTEPDDWADLSPSALSPATDDSTGIWSQVISGPDTTTSSGTPTNVLKGRVRLGSGSNWITMDPANPNIIVSEGANDRVVVGNLNGYFGISSDIYGFAAGDYSGNEYIKIDATNGLTISSASANAIAILGGGDITLTGGATPGKLIFDGGSYSAEIYMDGDDNCYFNPLTDQQLELYFGDSSGSKRWQKIGLYTRHSSLSYTYINSGLSSSYYSQIVALADATTLNCAIQAFETGGKVAQVAAAYAGSNMYVSVSADDNIYLRTGSGSTTAITINSSQVTTFSNFPITPSSAPSTDYQVANKKYVDDNSGASFTTWEEYAATSVWRPSGSTGRIGDSTHEVIQIYMYDAADIYFGYASPTKRINTTTTALNVLNDLTGGSLMIRNSGTGGVQIYNKNSSGTITMGTGSSPTIGFTLSASRVVSFNAYSDGSLSITGGNGTVSSSSDERLKNKKAPVGSSLDKICKLQGYHFRWNKLAEEIFGITDNKEYTGFMAQDVRSLFPRLVDDSKEYMGLDQFGLQPHIIEAIKELNFKIDNLMQ